MSVLLTAGAGLATSLFGGWQESRARNKMDNHIQKQQAENKAYYNSQAYTDYSQRSDAQNALRQMREQLDRQSRRSRDSTVVTGGTAEQTALEKEASNKALADTTANISGAGEQFRQRVTDQYMNRKQHLDHMGYQNLAGKAGGHQALKQTGLNLAAGAAESLLPKTSGNTKSDKEE